MKRKNNGLEEQIVKMVGFYLNHFAVNVDLENLDKAREVVANRNVTSGFKGGLVKAYTARAKEWN